MLQHSICLYHSQVDGRVGMEANQQRRFFDWKARNILEQVFEARALDDTEPLDVRMISSGKVVAGVFAFVDGLFAKEVLKERGKCSPIQIVGDSASIVALSCEISKRLERQRLKSLQH